MRSILRHQLYAIQVPLVVASILLSGASNAETVRLRPMGANTSSEQPLTEKIQTNNSQEVLLQEAMDMRTSQFTDKAKIEELQIKLKEAYEFGQKESAKAEYREQGRFGEIKIQEWRIEPTTLRENMEAWRHQAEQLTKSSIPFIWNLPGPVPLDVPAVFYGDWRNALWQLSLAFRDNGWDIGIEIAKTNNVVIFQPYSN